MAADMVVRRLAPYGLLSILLVGSVLTAWLGYGGTTAPSASESPFVARAIAATLKAGTADFAVRMVVRGAAPSFSGTEIGFGEVNFVSGTAKTAVETVGTESEDINGTSSQLPSRSTIEFRSTRSGNYELTPGSPGPTGLPGRPGSWIKLPSSSAAGPFRPLDASDVGVALSEFEQAAPSTKFTVVGHTTVQGERVTEYRWNADVLECFGIKQSTQVHSSGLSSVWIDARGRVRRLRISQLQLTDEAGQPPRIMTTITLQFIAFGQPVSVATPRVARAAASGSGTAATEQPKRISCKAP
jgi:hypothetical protein